MSSTVPRVTALDTYDIRFPTSRELDGSDAMNPDPDYSAAYLVLRTDAADGFTQIKLKVGADLDDDIRRMRTARAAVGPGIRIAIDANQRWNVREAIDWTNALAEFDPYWIEEPTSPDDVLGHAAVRRAVAPVKVATGEHVQNRIVFKQLLQADALDVLQIDAARVGGVNENLAILLLAAKYGVPVCPHAGGVGLCELVQHLSMFDYAALSGTTDDRVIEYVGHLHEHFTEPVRIRDGHYEAPLAPGFSAAMRPESIAAYTYPDGDFWVADRAARGPNGTDGSNGTDGPNGSEGAAA
ncbi:enolase C-terminal domain-like protein [Streptomyces sp. NPDC057654]|uniref:enolase C-terminal domain-like protein n=1 Tax=Streptomyces sp. NPDC057654 TaxID=3346196 RepID=UPI0036B1CA74